MEMRTGAGFLGIPGPLFFIFVFGGSFVRRIFSSFFKGTGTGATADGAMFPPSPEELSLSPLDSGEEDLEGGKSRAMTAGGSLDDLSHLLVPLTCAAQTFGAEGMGEFGF